MSKNPKSNIDLCAENLKALVDHVAVVAQTGTHEEFVSAWEQLQQTQNNFLSLVYSSPYVAVVVTQPPTVASDEELRFLDKD